LAFGYTRHGQIRVTAEGADGSPKDVTVSQDARLLRGKDLIVSALTAGPILTGGVELSVTVTNQGTESVLDASILRMTLRVGVLPGGYSLDLDVPPLGVNASRTFTASWKTVSPGIYTLRATADATNVVSEADEMNNTRSITVRR